MSKVTMLNMAGNEAGAIELKDEIFGIEPNQNAVQDVYKRQPVNMIAVRGAVLISAPRCFKEGVYKWQ